MTKPKHRRPQPSPLPHCEQCGLPIVSTMYPLKDVDGQAICSRHKEYQVKPTTYVCTANCRGRMYDDKDESTSMDLAAGNRGVIVEETSKVVKLKLLNGAMVSVVRGLFEKKWERQG